MAVGRKQAGTRGQKRNNGAENVGEAKGGGREDDTVIQVSPSTVGQDFGGGKKEPASGPMLKEEPAGFSRGLDLGGEEERRISAKFFGLESQKDAADLQEHRQRSRDLSGREGAVRSSSLHTSCLRCFLKSTWNGRAGMQAPMFYDHCWMGGTEGQRKQEEAPANHFPVRNHLCAGSCLGPHSVEASN